jgi:hypothetical protein
LIILFEAYIKNYVLQYKFIYFHERYTTLFYRLGIIKYAKKHTITH